MLLLRSLLLVAVSVVCAERNYFYKPGPATWDDARLHCQACFNDLTTITPTNAEFLGLNLTLDYWIGLRKNISGSKFWSRWANGEPVLYQNWYPGHPVPKKKPEPQPTCPPSPEINKTTPEVMQCPALTKLCACLNSSEDIDDDSIFNSTWSDIAFNRTPSGMMWCPALESLCACLNSSNGNETFIPKPTVVFTTTNIVPRITSTPTSTISNDLESNYIEDSCVALLRFGMWQEMQCNESLPYICYDDRFYGNVEISNVTSNGGILGWTEAGINISHYKIQINGNLTENLTNKTSYQIKGLDPGTFYRTQIIPVKCDRDLNAQNIAFYTLPEKIRNPNKVSVETNMIKLTWNASSGTNVSYLVNTEPGNFNTTCPTEKCSIANLQPGQMYSFIVKAVVNETVFGEPAYFEACTKPNKVINLITSNNASDTIYAQWSSDDNNSLQYSYKIILDNSTWVQNGSKFKAPSPLTSGTNYTLKVLATVPNCTDEGEAASINAYTTPHPVTKLQLNSTNETITATWERPNGNYAWFSVTLSSSMSDILFPTNITTDIKYTFKYLKTAALYNVSVTTYVKEDLNPSCTVTELIYTRPNSPGKANVQILNSTAAKLSWANPENSQGVKDISYSVKYVSEFWKHTGNLNLTGNTSIIISGLKSGSKYNFNVRVQAGGLESLPSKASGLTDPNIKTITLTMLCSSSTKLYCMNDTAIKDVFKEMNDSIKEIFEDNVFWNLTSTNLTASDKN